MKHHPILITAGATRNFIDSMRCITANASGRTGAWLACQLPNTTLLGSPSAELHQKLISTAFERRYIEFSSTTDLHNKMKKWVQKNPNGIIVHSAAVGDYEALPRSTKIPSGQKELHLTLGPTIKILDQIRKWSDHVKIISFKAASPETTLEELSIIAQKQRERTSSALVFANILGKIDKDVQLVTKDHVQTFSDREDALTALLQWIRREQEILDS